MTLDSESMSFNKNKDDMAGAIAAAAEAGESEFHSWFNKSGSGEQSFIRGAWDFAFYFASKEVCRYICQPEEKICLEIGYGGGRLLNASRSFFKWSHGIDVHPFAVKVSDLLLKLRPEKDFTLHTLDTPDVPIEDESIDYIYSFIVIQHFYSKDIFIRYLEEAQRLLVRGGIVNLYFADLGKHYQRFSSHVLAGRMHGVLEESVPPDNRSAYNTLWMSRRYVARRLIELGFEVLSMGDSYKRIPDGFPNQRGSQSGVLARKR